MSNYGIDYGTTLSLISSFDNGRFNSLRDIRSAVVVKDGVITAKGDEAWKDCSNRYFIKSPKKAIRNISESNPEERIIEGVSYGDIIRETLSELMSGINVTVDDYFTITVPNAYVGSQYIKMIRWLEDSIRRRKPDFNSFGNKISILPEPVAAALYYAHSVEMRGNSDDMNIVVCDIGGGTTDMCVVKCRKRKKEGLIHLQFEVIGKPVSDPCLGGDDFDEKLAQRMLNERDWKQNSDMRNFVNACKAMLSVDELFCDELNGTLYSFKRSHFEQAIGDELNKLRNLMKNLYDGCKEYGDGRWILLPVGGSCNIPAIRQRLEEVFFDKNPVNAFKDVDVFSIVAKGAALYSAYMSGGMNGYGSISIRLRTMNEIAYKGGDERKYVVVPVNSQDDTYLHAAKLSCNNSKSPDSYMVGDIVLYEGTAKLDVVPGFQAPLYGRDWRDVELSMHFTVANQRLIKCIIIDTGSDKIVKEWNINGFND